MSTPITPPSLPPGSAPDGNKDLIVSGMWVAKPFVAIDAYPEALVLTAADRRLARRLGTPVCLCRRRIGPHVVELLLARGEDRSVGLSLRIPTAANQFKDPYLLMEAEPGNTREVGVRELQFHLQGRLGDDDLAAADWGAYLGAAARKLEALRSARRGARARKASPTRSARARSAGRKPARARARPARKPRR
ncbi:MAG TPA: hypothetical protein VFL83_13595 [Anaeromyxobacter sp.]|nr:hypothetical protein [Anaeromyxobacter sp.]